MTGDISRVRCRLESAVSHLPDEPTSPADLFDRYEMVATQILDSEFEDYAPGMLQELLMSFLYVRQIELGLIVGPDPREE
tara:strand:- start:420 stop:659 length:240 start_codon:yes stop_codon:yes gene_type:complete